MTHPGPPPFHSRTHQLRVAIEPDANGAALYWAWALAMQEWWNTERPPLGRHHPDFPRIETADMEDAA